MCNSEGAKRFGSAEHISIHNLNGFGRIYMLSAFHAEDDLKEDSAWDLWKLIFNATVEATDKPGRNLRNASYKSTMQLLTS